MSEDGTASEHPYGTHQSASHTIAPDVPSGTAIELHLTSLFAKPSWIGRTGICFG